MDPLYALPSLLSSGFTSDFRFYGYYYISCSYPALSLVPIPPVSCSSLIIPWVLPVWYLFAPACFCSRHGFQRMFIIRFLSIHVDVFVHAIWLLPHHSPGEFYLTPLDPHVQVMELGACGFPQLLIRVAQLKHGSPANRLELYPSRAPLYASRVFPL